jgi:hypothetical protein
MEKSLMLGLMHLVFANHFNQSRAMPEELILVSHSRRKLVWLLNITLVDLDCHLELIRLNRT